MYHIRIHTYVQTETPLPTPIPRGLLTPPGLPKIQTQKQSRFPRPAAHTLFRRPTPAPFPPTPARFPARRLAGPQRQGFLSTGFYPFDLPVVSDFSATQRQPLPQPRRAGCPRRRRRPPQPQRQAALPAVEFGGDHLL